MTPYSEQGKPLSLIPRRLRSNVGTINRMSTSDDDMKLESLILRAEKSAPGTVAVDWILKVLGLVSAIIFGVYAPISYSLAKVGTKSNDEAQKQLLEEIKRLSSVQKALMEEIVHIRQRFEDFGDLKAYELCQRRHDSTVCAGVFGENILQKLMLNLVRQTPTVALPQPPSSRDAQPTTQEVLRSDVDAGLKVQSSTMDPVPTPNESPSTKPPLTESSAISGSFSRISNYVSVASTIGVKQPAPSEPPTSTFLTDVIGYTSIHGPVSLWRCPSNYAYISRSNYKSEWYCISRSPDFDPTTSAQSSKPTTSESPFSPSLIRTLTGDSTGYDQNIAFGRYSLKSRLPSSDHSFSHVHSWPSWIGGDWVPTRTGASATTTGPVMTLPACEMHIGAPLLSLSSVVTGFLVSLCIYVWMRISTKSIIRSRRNVSK